jgi:hypothetical protein
MAQNQLNENKTCLIRKISKVSIAHGRQYFLPIPTSLFLETSCSVYMKYQYVLNCRVIQLVRESTAVVWLNTLTSSQ